MRLTIEKLVYGGAGLARAETGVIFVPRTAPGDVVEVEVVERKKDYATARVVKIFEPSGDRQEPYCPNYETAGCCHWQHIRYDRQVDHKETIIRESLQRLGRLKWDGPIQRITGPDRNYRLRATFHTVERRLGFVQEKTNVVVPIRECASLVPELNQFIGTVDAGHAQQVHAISAPEVAATFVLPDGTMQRAGRATIHVEGVQYKITAETFFQANRFLLASFIKEILDQCGPSPRHVLELYAGVGFFSIPLAGIAKEVIAIESGRTAVRQARENARLNGRWQLEIVEGQVDATISGADLKPDVVVLDPPRTGCGVKNAERIAGLGAGRIVYVSCNPATFAREAAIFLAKNYDLRRITLIDQFPNTYHIELAALFEVR
jgi:23S rRNA (uracil1939-C5)-methyltransferase